MNKFLSICYSITGFIVLQENIALGIVPDYFDKHYTIAVNVYCSGSGFAIVLYPVLVQAFRGLYGWRGALLLLSGLLMQSIAFAAFLRTPTIKEKKLQELGGTGGQSNLTGTFLRMFQANLLTIPSFIGQVIIPGIVNGYVFSGWVIYIVSFSLSVGASRHQASLVATSGGVGLILIRLILPFLNLLLTHRQLLYISSVIMAVSIGMMTLFHNTIMLSIMSFIFCSGVGMLCTEIYIAARIVATEGQYIGAVSWYHFFYGFAIVAGGTLTGEILA